MCGQHEIIPQQSGIFFFLNSTSKYYQITITEMKEGNVLFNDTPNTLYLRFMASGHNYCNGPLR